MVFNSRSFASIKMEDPIVEIKQGKLRGRIAENIRGGNYYAFQGIPYAKPPIGDLRFKPPEPPVPWNDIWDATKEGNICYSRDMFLKIYRGSEDCLFLNVYTCELPKQLKPLKPVMVWIHGGGFTTGSGEIDIYGPDYLLKEDVVLVTINYRIGALGFVNFEDPSLEVPGNVGLKDMVMALKWVKDNISSFNGNPSNVTIFGESAGGASVHLLVLSPMAKGLFHRAIAQSGSALNPWVWAKPSAKLFADVLKIENWNEKKVLNVLKTLPVEELLQAQQKIRDQFRCDEKRPFGPVLEKFTKNGTAFISEEPLDLIKSGKYNKVPFMTGYTSREGMLYGLRFLFVNRMVPSPKDFEKAIPYLLNIPKGTERSKSIATQIRQFYFGDQDPSHENMNNTYELYTDTFFLRGIYDTVRQQQRTPVYLYRFSVEGNLNLVKRMMGIAQPGACHSDELAYLFSMKVVTDPIRAYSTEDLTIKRMSKLWTSFARNGNPNFKSNDDLYNVEWKPVEKNKLNFLEIGENLTVGVNPDSKRMAFWDLIFGTPSKL